MKFISRTDIKLLSSIVYTKHTKNRESIERMKDRKNFSSSQKKVLEHTFGKNYFKVKGAIRDLENENRRINEIFLKLETQAYR